MTKTPRRQSNGLEFSTVSLLAPLLHCSFIEQLLGGQGARERGRPSSTLRSDLPTGWHLSASSGKFQRTEVLLSGLDPGFHGGTTRISFGILTAVITPTPRHPLPYESPQSPLISVHFLFPPTGPARRKNLIVSLGNMGATRGSLLEKNPD